MAVGSSFAAMNTMYAAVARRTKEIGTLRVVGFSRWSIMLSFIIESVLIATIGGVRENGLVGYGVVADHAAVPPDSKPSAKIRPTDGRGEDSLQRVGREMPTLPPTA